MENNIDVISSLLNYIVNSHDTAKAMCTGLENDPERQEDYWQLQGAMAAWYYTAQAAEHYIRILTDVQVIDENTVEASNDAQA